MENISNFSLQLYTDVLFGKGTEKQVGTMVRKHGGTRVLLVYGGGSIKNTGLYDTVVESLQSEGISFVELAGVKPNPRRTMVYQGIQMAKDNHVDFLLGVGGGSVIDTCKAIGYGMYYDGDVWDFYTHKWTPEKMMPVGTIPTISAAGSETSTSSVLIDDVDTNRKISRSMPFARPVFAIMNPELTYTVSRYQTGAGSADIFAHTIERYFYRDECTLADAFGEGVLRTVVKYAPVAYQHPDHYEARAELMLCSSFSHNDLTGIGHSGLRGAPHNLEAQLSGKYDSAHGAGLALVMPAWLQYISNHDERARMRVAQLGMRVFDVAPDTQYIRWVADEGIRRLRAWLASIGMPQTMKELIGGENVNLKKLVSECNCNADGIVQGYLDLDKQAVEEIFRFMIGE